MDSDGIPLHENSRYDGSNMHKLGRERKLSKAIQRMMLIQEFRTELGLLIESGASLATRHILHQWVYTLLRISDDLSYVSSREKYPDVFLEESIRDMRDKRKSFTPEGISYPQKEEQLQPRSISHVGTKYGSIKEYIASRPTPDPVTNNEIDFEVKLNLEEKLHVLVQSESFNGTINTLSVAAAPLTPIASGVIKALGFALRFLYPSFQTTVPEDPDTTPSSIKGGLMSQLVSTQTKPQIKSMTVWGLIVIAIGGILQMFGLPGLQPEDLIILENFIAPLMEFIGLIVAYIGRLRARKPVEGIVTQQGAITQ